MMPSDVPTQYVNHLSSPIEGSIKWQPVKSLWVTSMWLMALIYCPSTLSLDTVLVFLITSAITLCLGHSLGMHRQLIHQSYECHRWIEILFIHLGVLVGIAGPIGMIRGHDIRDWAQRQSSCHSFFSHRESFLKDGFRQVHCDIELANPPQFHLPAKIKNDRAVLWMERTWIAQQIPLALLLFLLGGFAWVVWGTCLRVAVSTTGHWLVGHFAHRQGERHWHVKGSDVQGYNVKAAAMFTFGECWHNNHHAYPGSAKLGLYSGEIDPGWWVLSTLKKLGWVWNVKLPGDLPERKELQAL